MRVSALLYTLCAAGMRCGTLRCMPLQVRSAALRRIHAAHNIKVYRKACMERSAHGVQLSRSAHAHCTPRRIYGAQCACMGRSSAAARMRTARRGAVHCPADKMRAADGTCCARCVLSALCCTRCAPCALRSISALLYTLCAALHVCDTAQCAACPCRSAAQRCAAEMQRAK